jgi:hypothetical protein
LEQRIWNKKDCKNVLDIFRRILFSVPAKLVVTPPPLCRFGFFYYREASQYRFVCPVLSSERAGALSRRAGTNLSADSLKSSLSRSVGTQLWWRPVKRPKEFLSQ